MFDYKQRPFAKNLTEAEYDRATGRMTAEELTEWRLDMEDDAERERGASKFPHLPQPSPTLSAALEILSAPSPTGHTCNGTYKTFAAEHCIYCQPVCTDKYGFML